MRKPIENVWISEETHFSIHRSQAQEPETPRFNIAPTQSNVVLRLRNQDASLESSHMRWGLVPSWSKTSQTRAPLINARAETVADKPAFRAAFRRRRCLVPADGFYEWKKNRAGNMPYFFRMRDDGVFYFAGLWETWFGELGEELESYTILTTRANSLMAKYHDRMPVVLRGDRVLKWLRADPEHLDTQDQLALFEPLDPAEMECSPANPVVNNNRAEGPDCLEPPPQSPVSQLDLGL